MSAPKNRDDNGGLELDYLREAQASLDVYYEDKRGPTPELSAYQVLLESIAASLYTIAENLTQIAEDEIGV